MVSTGTKGAFRLEDPEPVTKTHSLSRFVSKGPKDRAPTSNLGLSTEALITGHCFAISDIRSTRIEVVPVELGTQVHRPSKAKTPLEGYLNAIIRRKHGHSVHCCSD